MVDTVATTTEEAATHPLSLFIRRQWATFAESAGEIASVARATGTVAGVAIAACDLIFKAPEALAAKDNLLLGLYLANGVIGSGLVLVSMYFMSAAVLPLFLVSILLGIAIGILRAAELKRWLSRCYFSKSKETYSSLKEELHAFKYAVEAS